jgi:hypothetical protein
MTNVPEKTHKLYLSTFSGMCGTINDYNEKELMFGSMQLNLRGTPPGLCIWDINHYKMGNLGIVRVVEQRAGNCVVESVPKYILLSEEVNNSEYGPKVEYYRAMATKEGTPEALAISDKFESEVREIIFEEIYTKYNGFVNMFFRDIEARLLNQVQVMPEKEPKEKSQQAYNIWKRMKPQTKAKFRKAWRIYQSMCKEYKKQVLDGWSTQAKPTIQDFRVRVVNDTNWSVGERRLREVINLGEANIIK